jgi:hypothetical protein
MIHLVETLLDIGVLSKVHRSVLIKHAVYLARRHVDVVLAADPLRRDKHR